MVIENFGHTRGRSHQVDAIVPLPVALHRKRFGPERITAAVFTLEDVKGEQVEPSQGLAVLVEKRRAEMNVRTGTNPRSLKADGFLARSLNRPQATHQQKSSKRNEVQVS